MSEFELSLRAARESYLEELARAGFDVHSSTEAWIEIDIDGYERPVPLELTIPEGFPFAPPKVRPLDGPADTSWHREPTGHLCLYTNVDAGDLPWTDPRVLLGRVREWYRRDALGWPDDPPDLDLVRYWPADPSGELILYGDEVVEGVSHVRTDTKRAAGSVKLLRNGPSTGRRTSAAYVVDLGDLARPPRSWDDLKGLIQGRSEAATSSRIIRDVERARIEYLFVRYKRGPYRDMIGLRLANRSNGLAAVTVAHEGAGTLWLRAGFDVESWMSRRVAVVGLGAVGSSAADLLCRAGVSQFVFLDDDRMRPGNAIRHLTGLASAGIPKVEAVRDHLAARQLIRQEDVETVQERLGSDPSLVERIFTDNDMVIEATGSEQVAALVQHAAAATGTPAVSARLHRGGEVVRVERWKAGTEHEVPFEIPRRNRPERPELREGECGDPVSPTPMWAVATAAGITVAIASDLVSGRNEYPDCVTYVIVEQPDAPMDSLGFV
jgi:hypothetical protein